MASTNEPFPEAAHHWDLDTLYKDLASAKGKHLTPMEKLHLRGLLSGHSPGEIAEKLHKSPKGVEVDLCNTLYQYVKILLGKCDRKMENWRNVAEWLEDAGYKSKSSLESEGDSLPAKFLVKKANIVLDKNKIIVDINLRIIASSPIEIESIEEFKPDEVDA